MKSSPKIVHHGLKSRRGSDGAHQLVWDAVSTHTRQRVSQGGTGTAGVPAGLSHALRPHPLEHTASKTRPLTRNSQPKNILFGILCECGLLHSTLPVNAHYEVNTAWVSHDHKLNAVAFLSSILALLMLWHTRDCNITFKCLAMLLEALKHVWNVIFCWLTSTLNVPRCLEQKLGTIYGWISVNFAIFGHISSRNQKERNYILCKATKGPLICLCSINGASKPMALFQCGKLELYYYYGHNRIWSF